MSEDTRDKYIDKLESQLREARRDSARLTWLDQKNRSVHQDGDMWAVWLDTAKDDEPLKFVGCLRDAIDKAAHLSGDLSGPTRFIPLANALSQNKQKYAVIGSFTHRVTGTCTDRDEVLSEEPNAKFIAIPEIWEVSDVEWLTEAELIRKIGDFYGHHD